MKDDLIERLDRWLFGALCGLALSMSLSIAVGNVFLGLGTVLFLVRLCYKRDDLLGRLAKVDKWIKYTAGAYWGVTFLSWAAGGFPWLGLRIMSAQLLLHVLPFFMLFMAGHDKKRLHTLAVLLFASVTLNSCIAIFQFVRAGVWTRYSGLTTMMTSATFLLLIIPILLDGFFRLTSVKHKAVIIFLVLLNGFAFLINGARGAWMAALLLVPSALLLSKAKKTSLLAGVFLALVMLGGIYHYIPDVQQRVHTITAANTQSRDERFRMWCSAYHMFQDHPLLGVGVGNYKSAYAAKYILPEAKEPFQGHAHNQVIHLLGERGLLGAASFLVMFIYIMYYAVQGWRKTGLQAYSLIFTIFLGFLLYGMTDTLMRTAVVPKFLWLTLAMCLRWIQIERIEE